jgi:hypothetical protein
MQDQIHTSPGQAASGFQLYLRHPTLRSSLIPTREKRGAPHPVRRAGPLMPRSRHITLAPDTITSIPAPRCYAGPPHDPPHMANISFSYQPARAQSALPVGSPIFRRADVHTNWDYCWLPPSQQLEVGAASGYERHLHEACFPATAERQCRRMGEIALHAARIWRHAHHLPIL